MDNLDDVIGYAGVDLREESENIFGRVQGAGGLKTVEGIELVHDRTRTQTFLDAQLLDIVIARVAMRHDIRRVDADVAPYIALASQARLRSLLQNMVAAAHHRTRTQTLPPPPLDPTTRLPLYKITPQLDVKRQLAALERVDREREQARKRELEETETRSREGAEPVTESTEGATGQQSGDEGEGRKGTAKEDEGGAEVSKPTTKRPRKRDTDDAKLASQRASISDDIRKRITNQTALLSAGGVRKAWMMAGTNDWASPAASDDRL
ncbi:hypothetical protein EV182_007911, partial [Spiromyces aspiralis]